jgi:uncharacterized membrane protein
MDQKEINRAEWENPDNWSGPGRDGFYFSKKDSRTWVPKSIPWMGWTLNLAKPAGAGWLVGLFVLIIVFPIVLHILVGKK